MAGASCGGHKALQKQPVLGTPQLIGAFCGEFSGACVGRYPGAGRTGAARRAPSACANSCCNGYTDENEIRTLRSDISRASDWCCWAFVSTELRAPEP